MSPLFFIPLGLFGVFRWICWLIHRIPASFYRPVVSQHYEPLSVVVPVYQEDPEVFRQAIESWLRNGVEEVICVIDVTDRTCEAIADSYGLHVIMTEVPGKRDALRRGWEAAVTPLVALVDSDTIWADDVVRRVCEPFVDPQVGGVGTRQSANNPMGLWQNAADMYLDLRYFDDIAAETVVGRAVSCLSGRTAVYRRELLFSVSDAFMSERFLGVPCMSGDDKRLTMLTLAAGYSTVLQRSARVWSSFAPDFRGFAGQRLRWARNTWRSDLRTLTKRWAWHHPMLTFMMINNMVGGFTLLLSFSFLVATVVAKAWLAALTLACWWIVSRSAKMLPHLRRRPENLRLVGAFISVSLMMATVKLLALLTVRKQEWITRDVAVVGGRIIRTDGDP